jgi:pyruvate-formate lyase
MASKKNKKPYSERTDIEKIESSWNKIKGLLKQEEWSSAIVRATTASEIASNLVIRHELEIIQKLEEDFVSHLMIWANGIHGKFQKLILPMTKNKTCHKDFKKLLTKIQDINTIRNSIVHQGQFKKKSTAIKIVNESKIIIETLVNEYHDNFKLKDIIPK